MQTLRVKANPLQAFSLLPCVITLACSNDLIARRRRHYENLFLIDSLEIKYLSHLGTSGDSRGAYTIINNYAVSEINFLTGSLDPEYENTHSSITQIKVKEVNDKSLSNNLEIPTDQSRLLLDGPINKTVHFSSLLQNIPGLNIGCY